MKIKATTTEELAFYEYKEVAPGVYAAIDRVAKKSRALFVQDDEQATLIIKPWGNFEGQALAGTGEA